MPMSLSSSPAARAAGWYQHPSSPSIIGYWDGAHWLDELSSAPCPREQSAVRPARRYAGRLPGPRRLAFALPLCVLPYAVFVPQLAHYLTR